MTVVACCGLTTVDLVQYTDRLPGPDEKVQARSAALDFGGPAANAAATAAALGVTARLITGLGADGLGRDITKRLHDFGVEVFDAAPDDWHLPVSSVAVLPDGARSVISVNAAGAPAMTAAPEAMSGVAALLVDGHHLPLAVAAARAARDAGVPVLLDGGSWKPGLDQLVELVDAAVLSADFRADCDWGERPVAVTHGSGPVTFRHGERSGEVPVPTVDAVDTLGAGDVFHGAWLAHVGRHGLRDFPAGLGYAAEVASASCGFAGVRGWIRRSGTDGRYGGN